MASLLRKLINALIEGGTPEEIGRRGEEKTARKLGWISYFGHEGRILQNVYVPKPDGTTSEVDLLYITAKGIYVIENKNYKGYIFGNDTRAQWTVTLYGGKTFWGRPIVEKHRFYNPIWQNKSHIRYLKQYLGESVPMFSVVVFADRCEFKALELSEEGAIVCHQHQLGSVIKGRWDLLLDVLRPGEVEQIYEMLLPLTNAEEATRAQHVQSIQSKINSTELCPACGGKLVLRTAHRGANAGGQFYGCSNYPMCKYTKNIAPEDW